MWHVQIHIECGMPFNNNRYNEMLHTYTAHWLHNGQAMSNCILASFVIPYGLTLVLYNAVVHFVLHILHSIWYSTKTEQRPSLLWQTMSTVNIFIASTHSFRTHFVSIPAVQQTDIIFEPSTFNRSPYETVVEWASLERTLEPFKWELWHTPVSFSFVMFNTLIYTPLSQFYVR